MTTIVAVKSHNGLIFGSDSQISGGYYDNLGSAKFLRNGEYIIGAAGDARVAQAVWYADLPKPVADAEGSYDKFVSRVLIPALRDIVSECESKPEHSAFIFGFRENIYEVHPYGLFIKSSNPFCVIGSGTMFARGYLKSRGAEEGYYMTLEDVRRALQAAAGSDLGTSEPFYIQEFPND